jgi:hypothetical protein
MRVFRLPVIPGVVAALLAAATALPAQLITPKTVPIAQGDQFNIFPSLTGGLGGVSIALDDSLGDPWVNPARATRFKASTLFSAPLFYSISGEGGAGRTLPLGVAGRSGPWSGAFVAATQQLDKGQRTSWTPNLVSDRSALNQYAAGAVAKRIDRLGLSVGGSIYAADLSAVDGVDQLYGNATRVEQMGGLFDARLGLTKEWSDSRALDVVLLYDRYNLRHDVIYQTWGWGPQPLWDSFAAPRDSIDYNQDLSVTWGAHLRYQRPLTATGWRVGWIGTFNKLEHPHIPNYDLMSVPRDPGSTRAVNIGAGISRVRGGTTFGVDAIYEPMWSDTWADAESDVVAVDGGTIPKGQKTVENDFTFSNSIVRMGVGHEEDLGSAGRPRVLGFQFGVSMRAIDYRLRQLDNVQKTRRTQNEDWVEWTPTLGLSMRFTDLELRYTSRTMLGVNRPGQSFGWAVAESAPRGVGVIVAPAAPLSMSPAHVWSQQLAVILPIR